MKILVDSAMPYWQELFQSFAQTLSSTSSQKKPVEQTSVIRFTAGDLLVLENHQIANETLRNDLSDIEYLLIRSTTKVNAVLLDLMPNLRFVATATAGYDHLDIEALKSREIAWYAAGGCNAQAVAQYVVCACLHLASKDKFLLKHKTVAVIGHGNVGRKVVESMLALGLRVIIYDPPQQQDKECSSSSSHVYATFSEVIEADIICMHAPLNSHAQYPSLHIFNRKVLAQLKPHQYVINAGRGELIDNIALLDIFEENCRKSTSSVNVVLDVWEHEPTINTALIPYLRLVSAHIAGHTLEGRAKGTYMLYQQLCERHGMQASISLESLLPAYNVELPQELLLSLHQETNIDDWQAQSIIKNLCENAYVIQNDDRVFRRHMAQSPSFAKIRLHYPIRREFSALPVSANNNKIKELLCGLGFIIANDSNTPLLNK